ncbi:MAG: hydrogenase [Ignavibacteriaceae bacterium]|nr:hydrogenase [Ignavibacteriaceae bacterium]
MILKRNFSPLKVWTFIQNSMLFSIFWSFAVWAIITFGGFTNFSINFAITGVLGSALAIFIAFRNNSAYSRWWEARTAWGNIENSARVLARLVITFTDSHSHKPSYKFERAENFKIEMINKIIAWVHSLRLSLRNQSFDELKNYLSDQEFAAVTQTDNITLNIQLLTGKRIYKAMSDETLAGFDSFQMEGQLLSLSNAQSVCERIKKTPLPRQYDFFTRLFVLIYLFILPLGTMSFFLTPGLSNLSFLGAILSIIISAVFVIMERTGAANEDPFENKVTDVPLTAICNSIERDLLRMLGDKSVPEKYYPENGYLF